MRVETERTAKAGVQNAERLKAAIKIEPGANNAANVVPHQRERGNNTASILKQLIKDRRARAAENAVIEERREALERERQAEQQRATLGMQQQMLEMQRMMAQSQQLMTMMMASKFGFPATPNASSTVDAAAASLPPQPPAGNL